MQQVDLTCELPLAALARCVDHAGCLTAGRKGDSASSGEELIEK